MKKTSFLLGLSLMLFISGCTGNFDIIDTSFNVESCDKYFSLMKCVLENDKSEDWTKERREKLVQSIKDMQNEWNQLNEDELDERCTTELHRFELIKEQLDEIWCYIE